MGAGRTLGRRRRSQARTDRGDRTRQGKSRGGGLSRYFPSNCCYKLSFTRRRRAMATQDRIYFAQRAAEEQALAQAAENPDVAEAHRKLQRAYLERASTGDRPHFSAEPI